MALSTALLGGAGIAPVLNCGHRGITVATSLHGKTHLILLQADTMQSSGTPDNDKHSNASDARDETKTPSKRSWAWKHCGRAVRVTPNQSGLGRLLNCRPRQLLDCLRQNRARNKNPKGLGPGRCGLTTNWSQLLLNAFLLLSPATARPMGLSREEPAQTSTPRTKSYIVPFSFACALTQGPNFCKGPQWAFFCGWGSHTSAICRPS